MYRRNNRDCLTSRLTIPGSRSKACCYATLAMSQDRLCERRTVLVIVLLLNHGIRASTAHRRHRRVNRCYIQLVPRSSKHLKCLHTYRTFSGSGSYNSLLCQRPLKVMLLWVSTPSQFCLQKQTKSGFCCLCQELDLWLIVFKFSTGYCITNSNA